MRIKQEHLAAFVSNALLSIRTGVQAARAQGLMADLPDYVDFTDIDVIHAGQVQSLTASTTTADSGTTTETRNTTGGTTTTRETGGVTKRTESGASTRTKEKGYNVLTDETSNSDITQTTGNNRQSNQSTKDATDTTIDTRNQRQQQGGSDTAEELITYQH